MKDSLTKYISKLATLASLVKKYKVIAIIVLFGGIYIFLVMNITKLTEAEPEATQLQVDPSQSIKRLKIDEAALARLRTLEAENIEVQTIFQNARQNPFSEE